LGGPARRGEGQQALYRRQGGEARLRASDAQVPELSSRRDRAGLGRRAGAGRGRGRTSGRDAGGRATSVARHAAGTGPNAPWRVRPRDHASTDAEGGGAAQPGARGRSGVSSSLRRGATTVNLTGPV
jgi:hypothetical protein